MSLTDDFFKPVNAIEGISESDYKSLSDYVRSLEAISRMIDLSYYIIDYKKREFVYVSDHPLFLAGNDREEVRLMGYEYFERVVPAEDMEMLLEINEKGFGFYYNLPPARRTKGYISYDFRIRHKNNSMVLINHKLTPVILNKEGNLWISLCLVTLSTARKPGNLYIMMQDEEVKYNYSFKTKKFLAAKSKSLTKTEKKVMGYLSLGNTTNTISQKLKISENTVKFHKKNIFKKLNVNSSNEAVYMAAMQKGDR